jgi:integrase
MRMRRLAPKTQAGYVRVVRQFAALPGRRPDTAAVEDLRRYQLHLVDHRISPVSLNAAITGLKFFFDITLNQPELMARMQPARVPRTLPVVLSPDEVARLIAATGNLKHQTALSVAYGAGLRASEVVALKVGDVDSHRMTLRIAQGKGRRDRYAMLSPVLLERLRVRWRVAHAQGRMLEGGWLFPGLDPVGPRRRWDRHPFHGYVPASSQATSRTRTQARTRKPAARHVRRCESAQASAPTKHPGENPAPRRCGRSAHSPRSRSRP